MIDRQMEGVGRGGRVGSPSARAGAVGSVHGAGPVPAPARLLAGAAVLLRPLATQPQPQ